MAKDIGFGARSAVVAMADLREAKKELSARFLAASAAPARATARTFTAAATPRPEHNVVGVGIGEKVVSGRATGIPAVKLFVRVKYPEGQLDSKLLLPKEIDGLAVDVEESGLLRRLERRRRRRRRPTPPAAAAIPNPRQRHRPAQPGCSVGFQFPTGASVMAGTFGALVRNAKGEVCVLSNNHVLADENRLPLGSAIFQPGLLDGGNSSKDQIASLTRFIDLQGGTANRVDAAIAALTSSKLATRDILHIGAPSGSAAAAIDMVVHKFGRTTAYTVGRVISVATDVSVDYETGTFVFEDQIMIVGLDGQPFSDSGDSGSLILDRATQRAVGLLFAGSSTHTVANHIGVVLAALKITLA
jgi:hypothetical protein